MQKEFGDFSFWTNSLFLSLKTFRAESLKFLTNAKCIKKSYGYLTKIRFYLKKKKTNCQKNKKT